MRVQKAYLKCDFCGESDTHDTPGGWHDTLGGWSEVYSVFLRDEEKSSLGNNKTDIHICPSCAKSLTDALSVVGIEFCYLKPVRDPLPFKQKWGRLIVGNIATKHPTSK
jgi:hypothetical protein